MSDPEIVQYVDAFLATRKQFYGSAEFVPHNETKDEYRWLRQLLHQGVPEAVVEIDYLPRVGDPKFNIHILLSQYNRAICRLDWDDRNHTNVGAASDDIPKFVCQPHIHYWSDNRHLVTDNKLPDRLKICRPLPDSVRTFEQAFKWFCDEHNIDFESPDIPVPPLGKLV